MFELVGQRRVVEQSDDILMQMVAKDDSSAVAALYDRHSRKAFGLAYRILNDGPAAEETVQDAFLQVWRRSDSFDPHRGAGFQAWLLTIVHHRAIDHLRKRARHVDRETELLPDAPYPGSVDPVSEVLSALDGDRVRQAMAALPDDQRSAIEYAYFRGMTHQEIADHVGLPLGTVKGRLRLGLRKLYTTLQNNGGMHHAAGGTQGGA